MKKFLLYVSIILLLPAAMAAAADDESWLQFGGSYQFRYDSLKGTVPTYTEFMFGTPINGYKVKNDALFTNRWSLNMKANPLEDISFKARLLSYKVWGSQTTEPINGHYIGMPAMLRPVMDNAQGHYPGGSDVYVDQGYAGWSNILEQPIWFSIGRKPATGGWPSNVRQNLEKTGTAGVPGFLIDAAFDGVTIGWAPYIEPMPGFFLKWCQGKGMESGYANASPISKDTDFGGLMTTFYDSDNLHVESLVMRVNHLMAAPSDGMMVLDHKWVSNADLGSISWWGLGGGGQVTDELHFFASVMQNFFNPSEEVRPDFKMGMLWHENYPMLRERRTGTGFYTGFRYDFTTGTKIGLEYTHGTRYWFPYGATSRDIWGNKLNTRGDTYEIYLVQELNEKPIAKRGQAFVRIGFQYYDFEYTGSLNWLEFPQKISELDSNTTAVGPPQQWLIPLRRATDLYVAFDVLF
jgi:hypothetical protein